MEDLEVLAYSGLGVLVALILFGIMIAKFIKKVPPEEAMSIFGIGRTKNNKYITNGAAIVLPFIHDYRVLSLTVMSLPIKLQRVLSNNSVRVNFELNATVKIGSSPEMLAFAFEAFAGKRGEDIKKNILDILQGQIREIITQMDIEKINEDEQMKIFKSNVLIKCETELAKIGVEVKNLNIENFSDDDGFFDAMAARAIEAKRSSEKIQQKTFETEARQREAELESTAVGIEETTRKERENYSLEADKDIEIIRQATEKDKAEAKKTTDVAKEQFRATTAKETSISDEAGNIETAKQQQVLAVETAKIETEKEKETVNIERAKADQQKEIERRITVVPAEKAAEAIVATAKGEATRIKELANAEQHKITAEGKGEADAILAIETAKALGVQKQIDALNSAKPEVIEFMKFEKLIPMLPKIIEAATKHFASIDNITLIGGSGQDSGNPINSFMEAAPLALMKAFETARAVGINIDGLADKIGITLPNGEKATMEDIVKVAKENNFDVDLTAQKLGIVLDEKTRKKLEKLKEKFKEDILDVSVKEVEEKKEAEVEVEVEAEVEVEVEVEETFELNKENLEDLSKKESSSTADEFAEAYGKKDNKE